MAKKVLDDFDSHPPGHCYYAGEEIEIPGRIPLKGRLTEVIDDEDNAGFEVGDVFYPISSFRGVEIRQSKNDLGVHIMEDAYLLDDFRGVNNFFRGI